MTRFHNVLIALAMASAMFVSGRAMAAQYGMAGCGIGAMVFKDEPGKIQILAATLNNIISPQTSAITSGTSNCQDDDSRTAQNFININKQALRKDISRGNGESVASLSKLLRCSNSELLGKSLQKNFGVIFPSESVSAEQIDTSIRATVKQDASLAASCPSVG